MTLARSDYTADNCHKVPSNRANQLAVHRRYYGQLVGQSTINHVVRIIGADALMASTHTHFNDIPMKHWDIAIKALPIAMSFTALGDYATEAGLVSVAKEAARQWVEEQTGKNKGPEE